MTTPKPPTFTPRFSPYHLLAIYSHDAPAPTVGSRVTPDLGQRYRTLCDLGGVPLVNLEVHSHFQSDPIEMGSGPGYFVRIPREELDEDQLGRLWLRGLFQQPVGTDAKSSDAADGPTSAPYPCNTSTQSDVLAYAVSPDADLARCKAVFESEEDEDGSKLLTFGWSEERADWQPIDYAQEASRATSAAIEEDPSGCSINPYAFLLVGGAESQHASDARKDVVTVVVPWRQEPLTLDPIRTFAATMKSAQEIVGGMGGLADPGLWRVEAESLLDEEPGAVVDVERWG